jgi:phosphoribosyl-dephospho-CoA transferase
MLSAHRVPVGLRGLTRSERCAAHVGADCVTHKVTPEDVARRLVIVASLRDSPPTCLRMLARLAPAFDESALCWGVTGSVGFTLASGCDVLHSESDLDLLVRAPHPGDVDGLRAVAARVRDAGPLVDVQVETPCGAFALKEWSRTGGPVMLKTALGPVLCEDPWHAEYPPSRAAGAPVTA